MHRSKPYQRPSTGDANGSWKHDLYPSANNNGASTSRPGSSLASRISGGAGDGGFGKAKSAAPSGSLLSRISGSQKGRELLTGPSSATPSPNNNTAVGASAKMHGYASTLPASTTNPNTGLELFPIANGAGQAAGGVRDTSFDRRAPGQGATGKPMARSVFSSGITAAGLGGAATPERERQARPRELIQSNQQQGMQYDGEYSQVREAVSILGQGKLWVRVENLAQGTTPEDVQSAFAPSPIISARPAISSSPNLVSIDLEYTDRSAAEELVRTYNGVVADGNTLRVSIVVVGPPAPVRASALAGRLGGGGGGDMSMNGRNGHGSQAGGGGLSSRLGGGDESARNGSTGGYGGASGSRNGNGNGTSRELFDSPSSGKMYSDTILRSDPSSGVLTLTDEQSSRSTYTSGAAERQNAWARSRGGGKSLSERVGRGGGGGGGGMVVDWS